MTLRFQFDEPAPRNQTKIYLIFHFDETLKSGESQDLLSPPLLDPQSLGQPHWERQPRPSSRPLSSLLASSTSMVSPTSRENLYS
ncbi:hypothetical protein CDL15_Pgr007948 [Punica granatum]|uniref:Uncharacterized protein n=1 Tax=Punica granatum TaxID=22663 RepID=A0A218XB28_PUNGR|nr:hypothetical protein CDL15_Pgr007948 [Punica granatum]